MGLNPDMNSTTGNKSNESQQTSKDDEIQSRLQRLKENRNITAGTSNDEIQKRLQKIKGDIPKVSDAELQERLANLRGVPVSVVQSQVHSKRIT